MTHQVELPDHVYQIIRREAEKAGLSPADWIAASVSQVGRLVPASQEAQTEERPLREVLQGLIGSFDSSQEQYGGREISPMTEMVADKLQKQGIEVPWRRPR